MEQKIRKFCFEDLDVYQKAVSFSGKIFDLFEKMPYRVQKPIGDNLLRAAISIANNIAEGSGRRSRKEKRHSFEISQGSVFECVPILTILRDKKVIKEIDFQELYEECYIISKMLSGLITHFS